MITTKTGTIHYCENDRGVFEERDNFFTKNLKNLLFLAREKRFIFILGQGKTTFFQHFCHGKRVYF